MIAAFIVLLTALLARRRAGLVATAWIEASHSQVQLIGDPPFQDDRFGMVLMGRVR